MNNINRKVLVSSIILGSSFLLVVFGLLAVLFISPDRVPYGTMVGEINLSGLTPSDAKIRINHYFPEFLKNRSLTLNIEGKTYQIPFKEIDFKLNEAATTQKIFQSPVGIKPWIKSIFAKEERKITPVYEFNKEMLTTKINELKKIVDRAETNAQVSIKSEDKLVKKPEIYGISLNVAKTLEKIKGATERGEVGLIKLVTGSEAELNSIKPRLTLADLEKVDGVIGKAYTEIESRRAVSAINIGVKAINNLFIQPSLKATGNIPQFSFIKCLQLENYRVSANSPGINQVASTLYNALTKAGLRKENFTIFPDKSDNEYTPNIPKVKIGVNNEDFKFRNEKDFPIIIQSEIKNDNVYVYILGKKAS